MKAKLPTIDIRADEVEVAKTDVDLYSGIISEIVQRVAGECTKDLDEFMRQTRKALKDIGSFTDEELIYSITEIPVLMYYTSDLMEELGIKSDSSAALKRERYDAYFALAVGRTIPDKQSETNELIKSEAVVEQAYKRAYKKVQNKLENASQLLASLKKVLSYRTDSLQQNASQGVAQGGHRNVRENKGEVF